MTEQEGIVYQGESVQSEPTPVEEIPVQPSGSPDPVPIEPTTEEEEDAQQE